MTDIITAYEAKKCPGCHGRGDIPVHPRFAMMGMDHCVRCHGSGKVYYREVTRDRRGAVLAQMALGLVVAVAGTVAMIVLAFSSLWALIGVWMFGSMAMMFGGMLSMTRAEKTCMYHITQTAPAPGTPSERSWHDLSMREA